MVLLQWYKNYRKKQIEKEMNKCIELNQYTIELCKKYEKEMYIQLTIAKIENSPIAKTYMEGQWEKLSRYDVDINLYNLMLDTYNQAIASRYRFDETYSTIKKHEEEAIKQKQIAIYREAFKQALLELQQEGKIIL